jgi:hypothetical protein
MDREGGLIDCGGRGIGHGSKVGAGAERCSAGVTGTPVPV